LIFRNNEECFCYAADCDLWLWSDLLLYFSVANNEFSANICSASFVSIPAFLKCKHSFAEIADVERQIIAFVWQHVITHFSGSNRRQSHPTPTSFHFKNTAQSSCFECNYGLAWVYRMPTGYVLCEPLATGLPLTIHPCRVRGRVSADPFHFRHTSNRIYNTDTPDCRAPIHCIDL
jgi:hypothetical protein